MALKSGRMPRFSVWRLALRGLWVIPCIKDSSKGPTGFSRAFRSTGSRDSAFRCLRCCLRCLRCLRCCWCSCFCDRNAKTQTRGHADKHADKHMNRHADADIDTGHAESTHAHVAHNVRQTRVCRTRCLGVCHQVNVGAHVVCVLLWVDKVLPKMQGGKYEIARRTVMPERQGLTPMFITL